MKDKELRKLIGSRAKQRRLELNLTQPYVAEKMGVTASTILRYENGSIDNTKKMVLEGLSEALHVSIEWLKGETDEYETDITDKKELQIRDVMGDILKQLPLDLNKTEDAFSKDLLLLMLKQYELFLDSFQFACKNYKGSTKDADIAKVMGFESKDEYNEIMFLREITHTVNAFNDMADVIRLYSKKPEAAEQRLANLLSEVMYEDSESVQLVAATRHEPPPPSHHDLGIGRHLQGSARGVHVVHLHLVRQHSAQRGIRIGEIALLNEQRIESRLLHGHQYSACGRPVADGHTALLNAILIAGASFFNAP